MKFKRLFSCACFFVSCGMIVLLTHTNTVAFETKDRTEFNSIHTIGTTASIEKSLVDWNSNLSIAQSSASTVQAPAPIVDANFNFACEPRNVDVHEFKAGLVSYCRQSDFNVAGTDSARVDIEPGAFRAPHWHDTWEQQIVLSGRGKTFAIDPKGVVHEEILEPGMISFLPVGWTHWSENIGDETLSFMFIFPAKFKTFEVGDSMVGLDPKVMEAVIGTKLNAVKHNKEALVAKAS